MDKTNGRFGEVSIEKCIHCDTLWLNYLIELEFFSNSGRWFRGRIETCDVNTITVLNALDYLRSLDWHFYGGSYYNSTGKRVNSKLSIDL